MAANDSIIETIIKVNSQTVGRDRLIRLLQYGSKYLWWLLDKYKVNRELVVIFRNLEYSLSTARKLLRLGRCMDVFYGALKSIHINDLILRITLTMGKISQALFLLTDHILWFDRMNLFRFDKTKWVRQSNKFWFLSILFFLMRDVYELWIALATEINFQKHHSEFRKSKYTHGSATNGGGQTNVMPFLNPTINCLQNHKDLVVDTVKNGCDLFIPMSSLGYVNLSNGMVGLLGVISSVSGILSLVDPVLKLQPN